MVQFYTSIPDNLVAWIKSQQMFCVATAPLTPSGHINLSPKGTQGTFHVVNGNKVWYEDLTGSGVETISHLRENGRITIMFTAFEGPPRIVRLFGQGTVHEFGTPEYQALISAETRKPGSRATIIIDVYKVSSSCGYSIPFYDFKAHRNILHNWGVACENRDLDFEAEPDSKADSDTFADNGIRNYQRKNNLKSLDGLPGLQTAYKIPLSSVVRFKSPTKPVPDKTVRESGKEAFASGARVGQAKLLIAFLLGLFLATGYSMLLGTLETVLTRFSLLV